MRLLRSSCRSPPADFAVASSTEMMPQLTQAKFTGRLRVPPTRSSASGAKKCFHPLSDAVSRGSAAA
jgi:hypothetical protein